MADAAPNTLTDEEKDQGWRLLFDGESTDLWRGFKTDSMPEGWQAVDGTLARVEKAGDIVTRETFADFELALEWKISEGGNSGVFFRVTDEYDQPWQSGPEMQIIDQERHPDGRKPLTMVGSNYALYPPKGGRDFSRPAGRWNAARIHVRGQHVEFFLNGQQVLAFDLQSPDWFRRVSSSKFARWPNFGLADRGYIGLQDHGDAVWFRNIKIREL
jgi:hypothetical protein